jgi:PAT family beta-lactamase induction signal transducer AmpG
MFHNNIISFITSPPGVAWLTFLKIAFIVFSAFMMSLSNKRFTATQYALLTSFMALSRYIAGAPSGILAKSLGWEMYFVICTFAGVPGLLLLTRFKKWTLPKEI